MIRYLLAGAALAAFASSAQARDHSAYFGLEIGAMFPSTASVANSVSDTKLFDLMYKQPGADGDLILGYDFGIIRAEIEASHKWAKQDDIHLAANGSTVNVTGHTSGFNGMGNVMLDLGKNDMVNFYVGGGAGLAWLNQQTHVAQALNVKVRDQGHFAWQAIAGVRAPVFRYFDVGLKYRYFDAGHFTDHGVRSGFKSHSILASLIYNFAEEPAPPPPPPPPPPATQTCPDGSVILATSTCPAPPPPPPPPPPTPERGGS